MCIIEVIHIYIYSNGVIWFIYIYIYIHIGDELCLSRGTVDYISHWLGDGGEGTGWGLPIKPPIANAWSEMKYISQQWFLVCYTGSSVYVITNRTVHNMISNHTKACYLGVRQYIVRQMGIIFQFSKSMSLHVSLSSRTRHYIQHNKNKHFASCNISLDKNHHE